MGFGGLALKLGVGSPGLPKTSWSSEVEKLALDGAVERTGSLASWQVLLRAGWEGQWMRWGGSSSSWVPACCPGHIPWALAGLALGAFLGPGFPGGLALHQGPRSRASSAAIKAVITCPSRGGSESREEEDESASWAEGTGARTIPMSIPDPSGATRATSFISPKQPSVP